MGYAARKEPLDENADLLGRGSPRSLPNRRLVSEDAAFATSAAEVLRAATREQ
jgi:hypothetical protein